MLLQDIFLTMRRIRGRGFLPTFFGWWRRVGDDGRTAAAKGLQKETKWLVLEEHPVGLGGTGRWSKRNRWLVQEEKIGADCRVLLLIK